MGKIRQRHKLKCKRMEALPSSVVTGYAKRSKQFNNQVYEAYGEGEGRQFSKLQSYIRILYHYVCQHISASANSRIYMYCKLKPQMNFAGHQQHQIPVLTRNLPSQRMPYWSDTAMDSEPAFSRTITFSEFSLPEPPYSATFWVFHVAYKCWLPSHSASNIQIYTNCSFPFSSKCSYNK